jgi:hypothetical protein
MRSCFTAIGCGALLVAGLVVGWLARDEIAGFVSGLAGGEETAVELAEPAGPALARQAERKVIALGQGATEEATLSVEEIEAWIRYGLKGFFPDYVAELSAAIEDERLVLAGRVAVKQVPGIERLGPAAALLGDTTAVSLRGRLDGLEPGHGVFYVDEIRIGLIPLPAAMRDELLAELRGGPADGLPANAVPFELPEFVTDVGVRGDEVFLRRSSPKDR